MVLRSGKFLFRDLDSGVVQNTHKFVPGPWNEYVFWAFVMGSQLSLLSCMLISCNGLPRHLILDAKAWTTARMCHFGSSLRGRT